MESLSPFGPRAVWYGMVWCGVVSYGPLIGTTLECGAVWSSFSPFPELQQKQELAPNHRDD